MTDNTTLPADWAIERALAEGNFVHISLAHVRGHPHAYRFIVTFARYIEKREQPPVDQWALQARELAAGLANECGMVQTTAAYRAGDFDQYPETKAIADALRDAYEKGKAE